MSGTPIALCLVVKDEADGIERAISSARAHVAEVNVLDTGSTDGTLETLGRLSAESGAPIRVERYDGEFDFESTRTLSYAMASPAIEWLMWMDADEELIGGECLSTLAEAADTSGLDCVRVVRQTMAPDWPHWRERLMLRGTGRWDGYAHAMWQPNNVQPALFAHPAALHVVNHRPMKWGVWTELARRGAEHGPTGLFELAGELFMSDPITAAELYRAYLTAIGSTTADRSYVNASRNLTNLLRRLERPNEEIAEVEAALNAFLIAFPWHLQLDALQQTLYAYDALLRIPAGLAGPVFATA